MEDAIKYAIKLGYIAGIIDGEGSIMLVGARHKSFMEQYKRRYPSYYPTLRVGMIEREPLDLLVEITGKGKVAQEKSYHRQRPMHRWTVYRKDDVYKVLKMIEPHLIVKRKQAQLLLEYMDKNPVCHISRPITKEISDMRREYWERIRALNGIASPATTEPLGKRGRSKSVRIESTV